MVGGAHATVWFVIVLLATLMASAAVPAEAAEDTPATLRTPRPREASRSARPSAPKPSPTTPSTGTSCTTEGCVEGIAARTFVFRPAAGTPTSDGRQYQIVAQHSGKCVEVCGGNLTNSGWVEQSVCHNAPALNDNRVWTVTWGHL